MTIKCIKSELLQTIADRASNLEELVLSHYDDLHIGNVTLHFEHLKNFTVRGIIDTMPSKLTFGKNLKEIEVSAVTQNITKVIERILQYKMSLNKLRMLVTLKDFVVSQLANAHMVVVEMELSCDRDIQVETIIKFIENSKYLRKFDLYFEEKSVGRSVMAAVEQRFPVQWQFSESDYSLSLLSI